MSSKLKGIIICAVIVLCLGGMLLILNLTDKGDSSSSSESSSSSSSEEEKIPMMDDLGEIDKTYVSSVSIINKTDDYVIKQKTAKGDEWAIPTLKDLNQNNTLYSSLITTIVDLSAEKIVEEKPDNLAKYGLDKPRAIATVQFLDKNKTKRVISVGNLTPDEQNYYVIMDNKKTVYAVESGRMSYFDYDQAEFISLSLLSAPASNDNYPDINKLTIKQKGLDYDMVIETDTSGNSVMASSQVLVEPINAYLDATNSVNITHGMWGLNANYAVKPLPTSADFKKYGLTDPQAKVVLDSSDGVYTLTIGNPIYKQTEDGKDTTVIVDYYVYFEGVAGVDAIFAVSADSLPWATQTPSDFITGLMTYNKVTDLKNIVVDIEGKKTTFALKSAIDEEATEASEDGEKVYTLDTVTVNKKKLDTENFKAWYQELLECPTTELCLEEPTNERYLKININLSNGDKDTLEFYKDTTRRYIVKLNGKTSFRIASTYLDKLLTDMNSVLEGKIIS